MKKQTIAVLFGGQSSEHEVSCISAANVADQIDSGRYDTVLIGITKDGHWLKAEDTSAMRDGSWRESRTGAVLLPDAGVHGIMISEGEDTKPLRIDMVFPVLHGLYGEDGTVQGLCELAGIPYAGCGVLASAVGMDKLYTKIIVDRLGVRQAAYEAVYKLELETSGEKEVIDRIEKRFAYPVFVKPSNAGSSRGVSKASDREELKAALFEAVKHDRKILVEENITGHEVECAVLGGGRRGVRASGVGEVIAAAGFYDYDAKYNNSESKTVLNPRLPGDAAERIPEIAARIFKAIDGFGLSRVDFFVTESGEVVFNEINTMPGFTAISMYPMLWAEKGIDKKELIQELIDLSFERE